MRNVSGLVITCPAVRKLASLLVVLAVPAAAHAESPSVASALDKDNPLDIFLTLDYEMSFKRALIRREGLGVADQPAPMDGELDYAQNTHVLTPRLQIGLYHDLELNVALPITISDSRTYSFASGVTAPGSSTIADGLLPMGGYDAGNPTGSLTGDDIFKGVERKGIDQLHIGLAWAPLSQKRDDTKPTWVVGGEFRLAIGKPMRFDRLNPGSEDGVGRGFHELRLYTVLGKQLTWGRVWTSAYWQTPLPGAGADATDAKPDTQFFDVGFGQDSIYPQQHGGISANLALLPYARPERGLAFAIQVGGSVDAHFQGRGYSEMWEIFAYAGDIRNNPDAPLRIDPNPTEANAFVSHPGVTTIENYLTWAGRITLRGELGPKVRLFAGFELSWDQAHRLSFDDAGNDRPACDGASTTSCETPNDDVVTPGTVEVNPLFAPLIDQPGHRYAIDDSLTYMVSFGAALMF
jgi:hypothetical protein